MFEIFLGYADYNCIATAVCTGGVCRCPTNWYYEVLTDTCDRDKHIGQVCTANYQCMTNSNCTTVAGVLRCQCISGTIYSVMSAACITPISYNQSCLSTADCASNFICTTVNGASYCLCGTDTRYYYSLNATCLDKVLYNLPCSSSGPYCDDVRLLQCSAYGNCTCPTGYYYGTNRCEASIFPGNACTSSTMCIPNANCVTNICTCITGSYYFDSTTGQCTALKSYGTSCTENEQCKTGLKCIGYICQCLTTQYYNSSSGSCTTYATISASCNSASGLYCNTGAGLYCNSTTSTCVCTTNYYWNGTKCVQSLNLYDPCTASAQCPTNALCTLGVCKCSATTYYNSTINTCVTYSSYNQQCIANVFVTSECSSTPGLTCSSTTSGVCQCSSTNYWNFISGTCVAKVSFGLSCVSASCNDQVGLSCLGTVCNCSTGYYWTGTACSTTLGAGQTCTATACTSPFICAATCQCPAAYYLDLYTVNCDLDKTTGTSCSYNFECSSNVCSSGLCT